MSLLEKTQALMEIERSLTATIEKVEPWLTSKTTSTGNQQQFGQRVRPIPTTMEQVHRILAVSRNFASRTSAPAGWNPNAPVMGFSTPNPLPHQLRGGALAALQLERARQAETDKKRKRVEEEEEAAKAKKELAETEKSKTTTTTANSQQQQPSSNPKIPASQTLRRAPRPQQQVLTTTMNLSDSDSSSEEDEDSDSRSLLDL